MGRDYEKAIGLEGPDMSTDNDLIARATAFMRNGGKIMGATE